MKRVRPLEFHFLYVSCRFRFRCCCCRCHRRSRCSLYFYFYLFLFCQIYIRSVTHSIYVSVVHSFIRTLVGSVFPFRSCSAQVCPTAPHISIYVFICYNFIIYIFFFILLSFFFRALKFLFISICGKHNHIRIAIRNKCDRVYTLVCMSSTENEFEYNLRFIEHTCWSWRRLYSVTSQYTTSGMYMYILYTTPKNKKQKMVRTHTWRQWKRLTERGTDNDFCCSK